MSALHAARLDNGVGVGGIPDNELTKAVQATIKPKQLVHLDWASVEDGSYILTVGVGSKVLNYAAVSSGKLGQIQTSKTLIYRNTEPVQIKSNAS